MYAEAKVLLVILSAALAALLIHRYFDMRGVISRIEPSVPAAMVGD